MDNVAQLETDTNFQSRKKITWGVFSVLLLFLVAGILYYFFVYRFYQSTDNAYVQADVTWVMPKISGEVMELLINDNQFVKKGETLAVLDHRDYQARYDQARSVVSLKEAALGVQQQNEKSARSSIIEANSGVVAAQADLVRLKKEFERYQDLLKDGVITRQNFEGIQSQYLTAQAQLSKAQAAVNAAEAQLGSLQASRAQLLADIQSANANLNLYQVDLASSKVVSPVSGKIGSLAIQQGSRVSPQTRLMAIIPENSLYVQANFKETQIEKMHIGQKVKLKLDAYPSLNFTGKIESFSPASGATFSLMPPDNATGNFNKVVQRIPVRITIDSSPHIDLIKPGMSVSATVDLRT
ncbi:HlyD family secretion protein [Acinetobacter baumannii]|uniref:HlyD family secretion protein n=1 Tax=Acinetobacter baumannii TaxID=470 RepID=UPI00044FFCF4|nr:HlyD family secretion protein [Acinetobacter baumannii]EXR23133.1 efflux transporter, RND family, MFP subunit [Acinetobacter baumannii 1295549]EXR89428.1 efflux transporter, RND family, MFP subunit [Acinetobacter baumannii 277047]EXS37919.1 efflux transporter, RND family, MFP subunit [Acinetobacter baumannii 426863]MCT9364427.1 HlyD family secretion protein [Acinetobacter baumannii]MDO7446305.1 HlyD family secretion protein [Acinetobacter baumannii]